MLGGPAGLSQYNCNKVMTPQGIEKSPLRLRRSPVCVELQCRRGMGIRSSRKRRVGRGRGGVVEEKAQHVWRQTTSYAENLPQHTVCKQEVSV